MADARYVLLGLAHARAPWFKEVSQWATSASIAAEFVKCVSGEEVRARLGAGRVHSALLIDASLAAFDRDLVATAAEANTPVFVVSDGRGPPWSPSEVGVTAVLPPTFGRADLLAALGTHAALVSRGDQLPPVLEERPAPMWRGQLLAVCGTGGVGASTVAIALAQGLAADARYGRQVLLADMALRADQAMLHDAQELGPGLQELVEAHRLGRPEPEEVRGATFEVSARGYRLLLGLRRSAAWSVLRPRAVDVTIDGLRRSFQIVVADLTGDLEGESEGGSIDVADRNHLARTATSTADVVFAVGSPGLKGTHSLGSLLRDLLAHGLEPARIVPVINRAPRHPRARAEMSAALAALVTTQAGTGSGRVSGAEGLLPGRSGAGLTGPVFLPERKVDDALRDAVGLPAAIVQPLVGAWSAVVDRLADAPPAATSFDPVPVTPGSLGTWTTGG